jgi:hypothetical protein
VDYFTGAWRCTPCTNVFFQPSQGVDQQIAIKFPPPFGGIGQAFGAKKPALPKDLFFIQQIHHLMEDEMYGTIPALTKVEIDKPGVRPNGYFFPIQRHR